MVAATARDGATERRSMMGMWRHMGIEVGDQGGGRVRQEIVICTRKRLLQMMWPSIHEWTQRLHRGTMAQQPMIALPLPFHLHTFIFYPLYLCSKLGGGRASIMMFGLIRVM